MVREPVSLQEARYVCARFSSLVADISDLKGKGGGQQTLRPLTIKQVLEASQPHPDADFSVDGVELGSVR